LTVQSLLTTNAAPAHERVGYWGDLVQRRGRSLFRQRYGASPREWRALGGRIPTTFAKE
jgi:hypothetical protein